MKIIASRIIMILITWLVTLTFAQIGYTETLFFDDFNSGKISNAYKFTASGKWEVKNGSLHQTNPASTDSCHAVIVDQKYPDEITIQTKLRVNDWVSGDYARTGIGVRVDPDKGGGTCIVEFDSVEVWDSGGSTRKLAVDAYGKLASTWAEIKVQ